MLDQVESNYGQTDSVCLSSRMEVFQSAIASIHIAKRIVNSKEDWNKLIDAVQTHMVEEAVPDEWDECVMDAMCDALGGPIHLGSRVTLIRAAYTSILIDSFYEKMRGVLNGWDIAQN